MRNMSEKRYFKIEYDEEWYLFDSATISEQLVKEQAEYGYGVFANSLSPSEVVDLLNELSEENGQLKKANNILYNENIQLRRILVNYKDLINDLKYLEEKGVFDGKKDKKNIWDVEPVVEKHS